MPDSFPFSERQLDVYDRFYDLSDSFVIGFGPRNVWLTQQEYGGVHEISDVVDGVYVNGIEKQDLDYKEVQVLAAIALINASEFKAAEVISPGDRSYDG